jgi:hypothetical protein
VKPAVLYNQSISPRFVKNNILEKIIFYRAEHGKVDNFLLAMFLHRLRLRGIDAILIVVDKNDRHHYLFTKRL